MKQWPGKLRGVFQLPATKRELAALPGFGAAMLWDRHGAKVAYTETNASTGITTAYDKHGNVVDEIHVAADSSGSLGTARLDRPNDEN